MPLRKTFLIVWAVVGSAAFSAPTSRAQESPYFVIYEHYLEEPGNLEIEYSSIFGTQRGGNNFHAHWMEFEYGVKAWWTTEFYLDCRILVNEGLGGSFFVGEHRGFVSAPLRCPHARSWFVSDQVFFAPAGSLVDGNSFATFSGGIWTQEW